MDFDAISVALWTRQRYVNALLPGHDAKLKKALVAEAQSGEKRAANKLEKLGAVGSGRLLFVLRIRSVCSNASRLMRLPRGFRPG